MKLQIQAVACLFAATLVGQAVAQGTCPAGSARVAGVGNALQNLLRDKTVCAQRGNERWQEYHNSNGQLVDYKLGPGNAVDPSEQVGTWSATNGDAAVASYNYGAGGTYAFVVCAVPTVANATSYTFIGPSTITGATLRAGQTSCP